MSGLQNHTLSMTATHPSGFPSEESKWYAVQTVARHEKRVATQFEGKQIFTFLPLLPQVRKWSDRQKLIDMPLFSCYTFVRIVPTAENCVNVLRTPGVLGFVGNKGQGTPIRNEEIETLRTTMREKIPCQSHPFIKVGNRVRIVGGCLDGIEGILKRHGADQSLIVSVELLQRSVSIRVDGYRVELV
jgi:transcription antitermination factor NusG